LFWGMLFAIASCMSGYLLSNTDDYDAALIFKHQWFGITVALTAVIAWYLNRRNKPTKWVIWLMPLLITITGHLGGSITHGSDYLTKAFFSDESEQRTAKRKPIPNVQDAVAYAAVIQPILESKCYNCHGANKQKGKLRLDQPDFILKGGKNGEILISGKPDESEMIKRILLSKENKDHMPPKEKSQLSKQDIELLHWWVSNGANFNKKVKELLQTEKIKPILLSLQSEEIVEAIKLSDIPVVAVEQAPAAAIQKLAQRGVAVLPVVQNSNYLLANFVAVESFTEKDLQLLEPLKKQLIWLKLGNSIITDNDLGNIARLSALTRLFLERTRVTDKGLEQIKNLTQLQYLNLVGTKVTTKGLEQLKDLKNLQQIFLYQTSIPATDWTNLKKIFPKTLIDTGGYKVPMLESDTIEKKAPVVN
jgi:mono/diheme cytochrome c family protein